MYYNVLQGLIQGVHKLEKFAFFPRYAPADPSCIQPPGKFQIQPRDSCTCHTCLFGLCQNLLTEQLPLSGPLTSKGVTFPRYSILEINQQIYIFNRNLQTFSKWVCNTTHRKKFTSTSQKKNYQYLLLLYRALYF